ncbi:DNA-binding response regulator, LytR/AlgR family [Flexibacter flexilis DSM 6793]|uniref:DNA-binding response regulator, LytR/AlgR family n=1 Tax=Flexibacter flexilis DSM 6793 TaxID=927664 RepID=A0A1I1GYV8_9BACT|nr:LytTR family DNA-binding domain-containing protein [Flexibacter flexilis]SFC14130.1 DNA-binding response regulator, LytR/AlgR family [Flexibacter flexilis DSM 6793]
MKNILIIEDEINAASEVANMLQEIDDEIIILKIIDSVESAIDWFGNNPPPDLIFSDIQLSDGLSFEIFDKVIINSPIVFCTAFDEYMMNAFDTNAISYLLKPVSEDMLLKALNKFKQLQSSFEKKTYQSKVYGLLNQIKPSYKKTILINQKDKIIPLATKEIAFFCLDRSIIHIVTHTNQKFFTTNTLDEIEKSLEPDTFYRANRQFIINKNYINSIERFFARKLVIKLIVNTPEPVVISKAKSSEFLEWLEGNTL